jgi:hypothetical protein
MHKAVDCITLKSPRLETLETRLEMEINESELVPFLINALL